MSTIASLWVSVGAKHDGFETGINKCRKALNRFVRDIPGANMLFNKFGAVLSAAGAAGAVAWGKTVADSIEKVGRVADRLNMTTAAYSALEKAAYLADIESASFSGHMDRLSKVIGDAASKGGESAEAFTRLGLSARGLATMDLGEALRSIADRIASIPNAAQRSSAAMAIFGRGGAEMASMLKGGRAQIDAWAASARAAGATLNDWDVSRINAMQDSVKLVRLQFEGLGNQIMVGLAPWVDSIAEKFGALKGQGRGAAEDITYGFGRFVQVLAKVYDWFELIRSGFHLMLASARNFAGGAIAAVAPVAAAFAKVADKMGLEGASDKIDDVRLWAEQQSTALFSLAEDSKTAAANAHAAWASGKHSKEAVQWFSEIQDRMYALRQEAKTTKNELAGAGGGGMLAALMGAASAKMQNLFGAGGSGGGTGRGPLDWLSKELDKATKLYDSAIADVAKRAETLRLEARTGFEVFKDELAELDWMLEHSRISQETYNRSVEKAAGVLRGAYGLDAKEQSRNIGSFGQPISLSRINVEALGGSTGGQQEQKVEDKQLPKVIEILKQIRDKKAAPAVAQ